MKSVDKNALRTHFDTLDKAIVQGATRESAQVARKTQFEPYDAIFGGRGNGG
jgi:hypothetical protein